LEYDNYYISAGNPVYSLAVYSTTAGLAGSMKNSNGFYKRVNSPSSTPTGHPSPKPVVGLVPTFQPTAIPTATLINGAFIAKATGSTLNAYVSATWLSSTICIMVGSQDSDGLISVSTIPDTIARKTDIDTAVAALVNSAPAALNTLGELAIALAADQSGITALNTSIGLKLSTTDAEATYETINNVSLKAPIANPTFTGTVTIPAGASISGYLTTANAASTYLTITNAASSYVTSTGLQNTLTAGGYLEEADRNVASGFAGVNASGYILPSLIQDGAITNAKLTNNQITINGNAVSLGGSLTVTAGYSNSNTSIGSNVISYGTSATPPSGTAVGDIYIQY